MFPKNLESDNNTSDVSEIEEIYRYLSLLWHWAWLIILLGGVTACGAFLITQQMTPVYQTSTSLLVLNAPYNEAQDYGSVQASQSLTGTYSDLLTEESILSEVISRLGLPTTPVLLSKSIKVTPVRSTQRVIISVKGTDQTQIADIANVMVRVFIDKITSIQTDRFTRTKENLLKELENLNSQIQSTDAEKKSANTQADIDRLEVQLVRYRELYAKMLDDYQQTRLAEVQSTINVIPISPAGLSYTLVSPKALIITLLAGMIGMVLAAGLVIARDALDKTLKTPEEINEKLNLPVLGVIYKHKTKGFPIVQAKPDSLTAEAFHLLSAKIQYGDLKHPVRTIMVTSPSKAEGKSTICLNLAIALAQAGNCVTLIDANFHSPVIHNWLKLSNNFGLTDFLLMDQTMRSIKSIKQKVLYENLSVVTAGANPNYKKEKNITKNFDSVLGELTDTNKYVVIDTPPVLTVADTVVFSTMVDEVLLVIQAGQTTLAEAKQAVESLCWVNARIIGVVLNNFDTKTSRRNLSFLNGKR